MAVSTSSPEAEGKSLESFGRGTRFEPDTRRPLGYRVSLGLIRSLFRFFLHPVVEGPGKVPAEGPVILAPVHRSFLDFGLAGFVTDRKFFFMAKDDLWKNKLLGRWLLYVGCFPVHRDSADRESLRRAEAVLKTGQVLVLFPEGTRKEGPVVRDLYEGPAFLAARTAAPILPMGIGGTDLAMPKGNLLPKRMQVRIVLGELIAPPQPGPSGRVSRSELHKTTELLHERIQQLYDEARVGYPYPYDETLDGSGEASADDRP